MGFKSKEFNIFSIVKKNDEIKNKKIILLRRKIKKGILRCVLVKHTGKQLWKSLNFECTNIGEIPGCLKEAHGVCK